MLIATGGKGAEGNLAQTEEILTGSFLPSLPSGLKNIALVVGTDNDDKNKVSKVLLQKDATGLTLIFSGIIHDRLDLQSSANLPGNRL